MALVGIFRFVNFHQLESLSRQKLHRSLQVLVSLNSYRWDLRVPPIMSKCVYFEIVFPKSKAFMGEDVGAVFFFLCFWWIIQFDQVKNVFFSSPKVFFCQDYSTKSVLFLCVLGKNFGRNDPAQKEIQTWKNCEKIHVDFRFLSHQLIVSKFNHTVKSSACGCVRVRASACVSMVRRCCRIVVFHYILHWCGFQIELSTHKGANGSKWGRTTLMTCKHRSWQREIANSEFNKRNIHITVYS